MGSEARFSSFSCRPLAIADKPEYCHSNIRTKGDIHRTIFFALMLGLVDFREIRDNKLEDRVEIIMAAKSVEGVFL